jgi:hypothetical protein
MRLEIEGRGLALDEAFRAHLEASVLEGLGRHRGEVARISAEASREACRLIVLLAPSGAVAVEARGEEPFGAAARAAEAAGRAVARELTRRRRVTAPPKGNGAVYAHME